MIDEIATYIIVYWLIGIVSKIILSSIDVSKIDIGPDVRDIMYKSPLMGLLLPIIFWPISLICTFTMLLHFWVLKILNKIL